MQECTSCWKLALSSTASRSEVDVTKKKRLVYVIYMPKIKRTTIVSVFEPKGPMEQNLDFQAIVHSHPILIM